MSSDSLGSPSVRPPPKSGKREFLRTRSMDDAVLPPGMKSGFKETITSTINLPEDNAAHIRMMLEFLYTWSYDLLNVSEKDKTENPGDNEDNVNDNNDDDDDQHRKIAILDTIISLYALGDKYDIPRLRDHTALDFDKTLRDV
ncbi:MAG: hypothetical protein Q9169_006112 [Polycauliona sp. 2 TL-2023]